MTLESSTAMIRFDAVTRTYGKKVAVDNLSLTIPPGELFAFLGPNGAGKTTAIKLMTGLLQPTSGTVAVCGYNTATHAREASRFLGYVPEEAFLYDKLSGREFLEFVAEMRGIDGAEKLARVDRQVELFGLAEFFDDVAESYSHGMRQRLVFAAAMLHDPPVFVVDEPTIGLDPKSVRLIKDLLRAKASAGAIVFMSTHTLSVAEEIADRIGIIDRGRLSFLGTIAELRQAFSDHDHSLEHLFLEFTKTNGDHRPAEAFRPAAENSSRGSE
jgi:ABC-2 type transport system ATP-binding protein